MIKRSIKRYQPHKSCGPISAYKLVRLHFAIANMYNTTLLKDTHKKNTWKSVCSEGGWGRRTVVNRKLHFILSEQIIIRIINEQHCEIAFGASLPSAENDICEII